jgi:hypothetical protein
MQSIARTPDNVNGYDLRTQAGREKVGTSVKLESGRNRESMGRWSGYWWVASGGAGV